jgi:hypothetical protein
MVPEGQVAGHKKGNYFTFVYWKESFKMKHRANGTNIYYMVEIQVYSNEDPSPLQGVGEGDNHKRAKNRVGSFKKIFS